MEIVMVSDPLYLRFLQADTLQEVKEIAELARLMELSFKDEARKKWEDKTREQYALLKLNWNHPTVDIAEAIRIFCDGCCLAALPYRKRLGELRSFQTFFEQRKCARQ